MANKAAHLTALAGQYFDRPTNDGGLYNLPANSTRTLIVRAKFAAFSGSSQVLAANYNGATGWALYNIGGGNGMYLYDAATAVSTVLPGCSNTLSAGVAYMFWVTFQDISGVRSVPHSGVAVGGVVTDGAILSGTLSMADSTLGITIGGPPGSGDANADVYEAAWFAGGLTLAQIESLYATGFADSAYKFAPTAYWSMANGDALDYADGVGAGPHPLTNHGSVPFVNAPEPVFGLPPSQPTPSPTPASGIGFSFDPTKHVALLTPKNRKVFTDGLTDLGTGGYNAPATNPIVIRRSTAGGGAWVGKNATNDIFTATADSAMLTAIQGEAALSVVAEWQGVETTVNSSFHNMLAHVSDHAINFGIYIFMLAFKSAPTAYGQIYVGWDDGGSGVEEATGVFMPPFVPMVLTLVRKNDPINVGKMQVLFYVGDNTTPVFTASNLNPVVTLVPGSGAALAVGNVLPTFPGGSDWTSSCIHGDTLLWKVAPSASDVMAQHARVIPNSGWNPEGTGLGIGVGGFSVGMKFGAVDAPPGPTLRIEGRMPGDPESAASPSEAITVRNLGPDSAITNVYSANGLSGRRFAAGTTGCRHWLSGADTWNGVIGTKHTMDFGLRAPTLATSPKQIDPVYIMDSLSPTIFLYWRVDSTTGDLYFSTLISSVTTDILRFPAVFPSPNLKHIKEIYDPYAQTVTGYLADIDVAPGTVPALVTQATGFTMPFDPRQVNGNTVSAPALHGMLFGDNSGANVAFEVYAPTLRSGAWLDAYNAKGSSTGGGVVSGFNQGFD